MSYSSPYNIHFSGGSGVSAAIALNKDSLPVLFSIFFVIDKILKLMVVKTNRDANDLLSKAIGKDKSRLKLWVNTTNTEMKAFVGLLFTVIISPSSFVFIISLSWASKAHLYFLFLRQPKKAFACSSITLYFALFCTALIFIFHAFCTVALALL